MQKKNQLIIGILLYSTLAGNALAQESDVDVIGPGVSSSVTSGRSVVVVALEPPENIAGGAGLTSSAINSLQNQVTGAVSGVREIYRFNNIPALVVELDNMTDLNALSRNPGVRRIDLDVGGTGLLADSAPLLGASSRHGQSNSGSNVTVAVIDTGIDSDHPDLIDNVSSGQACFGFNGSVTGFGFCPNGSDLQTGSGAAEDDAGHGTHVSGIITSSGVVAPPGIAPDADVVAIKSLDNCSLGGCFYSFTLNVVAALDYIIDNPQLGIGIINMSLGTSAQFAGDCDNATSWTMAGAAAINTLRDMGVTAFASAGNSGSGTSMGAPACLSNVISVGASNDFDTVASFSDSNSKTDIFAPGVSIISDAIGGSTIPLSGTSMASPTAAGCAALLIESGEATSPDTIEARLQTSSVHVFDPTNGLSFPRIDCSPCPLVFALLDQTVTDARFYSAVDEVTVASVFDSTSDTRVIAEKISFVGDSSISGTFSAGHGPDGCASGV